MKGGQEKAQNSEHCDVQAVQVRLSDAFANSAHLEQCASGFLEQNGHEAGAALCEPGLLLLWHVT